MQENKTVKEWREAYRKKVAVPSKYAGYAYDAMWVYAYALDKMLRKNPHYYADFHSEEATRYFFFDHLPVTLLILF